MTMQYHELIEILQTIGKDPSRLIFEDELTGINNRRFLHSFFEHKVQWDDSEDLPLSLLMLDLDHFKEVNDTYGHDVGDQVLVWLSSTMKEIGGTNGVPVRYGGDEFMLLVPGADAGQARKLAEQLLQRAKERPFRLRDSHDVLPVTVSVGVACAPHDAGDGDGLIHKADAALYHAKNAGRNRAANAHDIDLQQVFPKSALRRLKSSGVVGRDAELAAVSEGLDAISRRKSGWQIFEGGPGMGKSAVLRAVRKNIEADPSFQVVNAAGVQQEGFRPYYLLTSILITLLSEQTGDGDALLASLTPEQTAHLGVILPQLGGTGAETLEETEAERREGLFNTAIGLIAKLSNSRPLVLLLDDLQFADEPTLYLLRGLMKRPDLSLLVCSTAMESLAPDGPSEGPPLTRFRAKYEQQLDIHSVKLRPLGPDDITSHLRAVFPGLEVPDALVTQLTSATQGNPLFLIEIIRKLVLDQKVSVVGQEWAIKPLENGYLPRSLEEIVAQKIDALDESDKDLLAHASTLGEDVPVSVLAGASERSEQDVLEFLDHAEELGLVQQDFQLNDESMHFLGKRVLEICYGQIACDRRQQLHERAGAYQETLNEDSLGPAASLLAYHYKRSANQTKAREYERVQTVYRDTVFNSTEAADYVADTEADEEIEERLKPESLPRLPSLVRTLVSAIRAIQLYPAESRAALDARRHALGAIEAILADNRRLHLTRVDKALLANGQRLDVGERANLPGRSDGRSSRPSSKGSPSWPVSPSPSSAPSSKRSARPSRRRSTRGSGVVSLNRSDSSTFASSRCATTRCGAGSLSPQVPRPSASGRRSSRKRRWPRSPRCCRRSTGPPPTSSCIRQGAGRSRSRSSSCATRCSRFCAFARHATWPWPTARCWPTACACPPKRSRPSLNAS